MEILFFLIVIFVAAFFQGVTGFGFALIAAPLALLFLDKVSVVVSIAIAGVVVNPFLFLHNKEQINQKIFLPLLLGSFIGMPIGLYILQQVSINYLKIFAGTMAILSTLLIYSSKSYLKQNKFISSFVGMLSGVLQTSISMSGPPVVLLLAGHNIQKDEVRKLLNTYFFIISILTICLFIVTGIVTFENVKYGILAIPAIFLGAYIGNLAVKKIPQELFRKITLVAICITGVISIYSGL